CFLIRPPWLDNAVIYEDLTMNHFTASGRGVEALTRAVHHWETRPTDEPIPVTPPFTIAISRQAGCNASAIARAVGDLLGWPVYDRELIDRIADDMGLHSQLVQSVDERRSGWLAECLESFTSRPGVSEAAYVHHLRPVLFSLAAHGNCVIV